MPSRKGLVEQLQNQKQKDLALAEQPLVMVASAHGVPLLQPYVSSQQISGMVSGLAEAARYDSARGVFPQSALVLGLVWDWTGDGYRLIVIGSLWVCLRDFVAAPKLNRE